MGCLGIVVLLAAVIIIVPGLLSGEGGFGDKRDVTSEERRAMEKISEFAAENGLRKKDWPDELVEMLAKNPEAEEFVLNYPLKKDSETEYDLEEYLNSENVPLLLQWDERWGYHKYGSSVMGLSGCGPTCLSMVSVYLLGDKSLDPGYIADFSTRYGYCVPGNGSSWTLISEGGEKLGLEVTELPLDENVIKNNLNDGKPIICVMGPGDFTETGHFIVMTGIEDGKIKVNDPNSRQRSEKLWEYSDIENQIRNLWACCA